MSILKPWVKSLRTRYLVVAISSMCFVIIVVVMVNHYITETNQILFDDIERRLPVSLIKEDLRRNIKLASRDLNLYLIEPTQIHKIRFDRHIREAQKDNITLVNSPWVAKSEITITVNELQDILFALQKRATELMFLRLDANDMYPVLQMANTPMLEANGIITTSLSRSIEEQRNELTYNPELMNLLVDVRDTWRRVIASYRIYIVNRMGSLFISSLSGQVQGINDIFNNLEEKIKLLAQASEKYDTGLETLESIVFVQEQAPRWYVAFEKIVQIEVINEWRSDVDVMVSEIYPMLDQIFVHLETIDRKLHQSSLTDLNFKQKSRQNLSYALWVLSAFIFFVIIFCYVVLDRALLKPIALVSRSLRENSGTRLDELLPSVKGTEMLEFVNAFGYMQKQIQSRQEELVRTATHDALTHLPNRSLLTDKLTTLIAQSRTANNVFALMILDLDRFKEVNDTLGHLFGDKLLCEVANRLKNILRKSDFVARLGGDEFAILISDIEKNEVAAIAKTICNAVEEVYTIDDHNLYLGSSIGISLFPQHGNSGVTLMKHADIAMYHAKGTNINFDVYESQKNEHNVVKLSLLSDLRIAIDNDELFIELQPIYSANENSTFTVNNGENTENSILGFEALIRWQHPRHGVIYPDAFIQTAEQTGLIRKITCWVLEKSLSVCKSWQPYSNDIYISVNVTAWDLQENIVVVIRELLDKYQLQPGNLVLELTERSVMSESVKVKNTLEKLSRAGVRFAMDDFGTGFSSMTYLQELPISLLKIDRSFVMYMAEQKSDATIVKSIIDLAHNLGLGVIAEGVETRESLEKLIALKCNGLQGNYLSRPVGEAGVIPLIEMIESRPSPYMLNKS